LFFSFVLVVQTLKPTPTSDNVLIAINLRLFIVVSNQFGLEYFQPFANCSES